MSKPCKDCNDDCIKHNKITRPDFFITGIDTVRFKQYWIPVNDALSIGGLNTSYDDETEWFTQAYLGDYTLIGTAAFPIFNSLQQGIDAVYVAAASFPSFIDAFVIYVENLNYGNSVMSHPSFLKWAWQPDQIPYGSLKDPTWNISFPQCTTKDKLYSNGGWKLKDCGVWKIEYRLRVRPIIPMSSDPALGTGCYDWAKDTQTYEEMKDAMRFYKSLESQEGSKAMGIAPMRLESGIYSHDTLKYKPIVWSDGTYPQIIPNNRNYWSSKYPKEMSLATTSYNGTEPPCERQSWHIGGPEPITIYDTTSPPNSNDISYKYDANYTTISKGLIIPGTNSLTNPVTLTFSNFDSIGKKTLLDWLSGFDLTGATSKVGEIQIDIEGKINGNWILSTTLNYNITDIAFNTNDIVLNVNSNSSNPEYQDNLGSGYSSSQFYSFDSLQTRYLISVSNTIPGDIVPQYSVGDTKSRTFTPLTEDFVVELEGFTYVNLDKEKEVSIYLKVLPEHNDHGAGGIYPINADMFVLNVEPWYSSVGGNSNVASTVTTSGVWPWAPLSVDRRTKFTEQLNVKYEPLLPLDLYWEDKLINNDGFRRAFRYNENDKHWYIMIEEGWVSATKVCEDCDC